PALSALARSSPPPKAGAEAPSRSITLSAERGAVATGGSVEPPSVLSARCVANRTTADATPIPTAPSAVFAFIACSVEPLADARTLPSLLGHVCVSNAPRGGRFRAGNRYPARQHRTPGGRTERRSRPGHPLESAHNDNDGRTGHDAPHALSYRSPADDDPRRARRRAALAPSGRGPRRHRRVHDVRVAGG